MLIETKDRPDYSLANATFSRPVLENLKLPEHSEAKRAVLRERLRAHRIPVDTHWDRDSAKGFDDLVLELDNRDSQLISASTTLIRQVRVARVDCYHEADSGQVLKLYEAYQRFFNPARTRVRDQTMAIWEKLRPEEDAFRGAVRGIIEELKIPPPDQITKLQFRSILEPPRDYPGIPGFSEQFDFCAIIPKESFKPVYTDRQKDKETVFFWRPCETNEVAFFNSVRQRMR